jgi:hypothetical protein
VPDFTLYESFGTFIVIQFSESWYHPESDTNRCIVLMREIVGVHQLQPGGVENGENIVHWLIA